MPHDKPLDPTKGASGPLRPVDARVEGYLLKLLSARNHEILAEMEAYAAEHRFPIVGRNVGVFLEVMTKSIGARTIFEFGSGYGYSAYWFARGVGEGGKVVCTDGDEKNIAALNRNMERAGFASRIESRVGWAQKIFSERYSNRQFDLIYNDVDKDAYPEVWKLARDHIRPGGLYIADNCLWGGRVVFDEVTEDVVAGFTEGVKEHNELISRDPDFDFFMNPVRDGVIVARRR